MLFSAQCHVVKASSLVKFDVVKPQVVPTVMTTYTWLTTAVTSPINPPLLPGVTQAPARSNGLLLTGAW